MANVTIYTTPTCGYCKAAKAFFQEHGVTYTEKDVTVDEAARDEMIQKSGQLGVPVIFVNDEIVIGFNQPKLSQLLAIS
ncbi:NrdH-redoxin [Candidatus Uhrbacteria bacterium CG10_big_fil_rev_8_21_14_0_10_48_11]|uniref:NrdH-redoxin n=1 Tax=Candidatus Uhrbacteria bacterium CG10_big_fil_rev_8_21_14_0_10_48_11 TaxID=1975037 RepID=A0A2M8LDJ4_9BACT|nr:MAG: NrdH-redoxin [Candidatus Uhrbacteria bacterium CG10_big_fil_rev_8_21_14_0_10_48_11]